MIVLLGIAFVAGIVTALSPCILPVLPIILAGSASGTRRKPYAIVAGLVASFTLFTLAATWLLDLLHLRQDLLRDLAIAMLFVLAATLLVPRLAELLERPFLFLTRRRAGDLGGGFVLGASLGLVFVPCAGPVFAAVSVLAATHRVGGKAIAVTIAYAIGAAVPLLMFAAGSRRAGARLRTRGPAIRAAMGVLMAVGAFAILKNWDQSLQTRLGGYTTSIQNWVEDSSAADRELAKLRGGTSKAIAQPSNHLLAAKLDDLGPAPDFTGISTWLNTPGGRPLSVAGLRGKVVLVDFWTYSCINCLRTLPHLEAWDRAYRKAGLVIVGVHTPEFAFEHSLSNVREATRRLGVRYPVALDNDYATWNAYANQFWPAEYLIDRGGHLRHFHFGEGEYGKTEQLIRSLLAMPGTRLPTTAAIADRTPMAVITPESYLGYQRLDRYSGSKVVRDSEATYRFPSTLP